MEQTDSFQYEVTYGESKENCNCKTITKYITELNGKTVPSKLAIKYHFYSNSSNNSTFFTLEIEYDKLCVNLFYEYQNSVAKKTIDNICFNVKDFFKYLSNNNIQVESIVINRPIEQVWELISNLKLLIQTLFQENKENVNISEECNQDTGKY